jgi:hypothetical protein
MLRSIRKLFKSLTNILEVSYNIDKGKNANSSRAVLCVDVKKVNVFVKGEITGSEEILSRYVKTLRPSRDELEASLKAELTLEDLLEDEKAIRHEGGCILWPTKAKDLRSTVVVDGVAMDRHRAAFLLAGNTLQPGNVVRHTCDVPHCFNPDHLIEGTHADNMRDASKRGRRNAGSQKLDPVERALRTLKERSERLRRYGNADWFEGWDDNHHIEME